MENANASPLELFWTATALVGLIAALWSGGVSTARGIIAKRMGHNGPTALLFYSNVLTALMFIIICGLFAVSGLIAIATPPPTVAQNKEASDQISLIFTMVNILIAGYLLIKIYLNSKIDAAVLKDAKKVHTTRLATEAATARALLASATATTTALAKAAGDIAEARAGTAGKGVLIVLSDPAPASAAASDQAQTAEESDKEQKEEEEA